MLKKYAANYCFLGLVAITTSACSTNESRSSLPIREALPVVPVPQRNTLPPPVRNIPQTNNIPQNRGAYVYPEFEEYKPQSSGFYARPEDSFESYTPQEPESSAFTTPLGEAPPVVVERLSPPVVEEKPVPVAPVVPPKPVVKEAPDNELDIDPFADIPERETLAVRRNNSPARPAPAATTKRLSVAANALLVGAKAEAAVGRYDAAINKVERALRIEPNSPTLWYELGNLNYGKGRYDQAISLSRKSLAMSTGNRGLVSQNLDLMSKAATKTGNTRVFKEVLDYKRQNP